MLLLSVFGVAACGIAYELVIGAIATYLLGSSVLHFSLTIGLFLSAMGLGAFASRWIRGRLLSRFIAVEIVIGLVGGLAGVALFAAYTYTRLYAPVMYATILVIGGLTGLEIPLLTRYLQRFGSVREALANVLSFDYLGALLASFALPLVLLPTLGLLKSAICVGLINLAVAAVTLAAFRGRLAGSARLWAATLASAGILVAALVGATPMIDLFEATLYQDEVIHAEQSAYQRIVLTRYRDDLRLYLDGSLQASSRDEYRYHESLVHPALSLAANREHVLVLGGGDGLVTREVLRDPEVRQVTVVDIDPAMTRLAREHPMLRELNGDSFHDPRVTVVNDDAYAYLAKSSDLWSVILVDFPDPRTEPLVKLYSVSFYGMLRRHLARGGVAATQATSPLFARKAFWCIVRSAETADLRALPYHAYVPSFGEWGFVLLSERELSPEDIRLRVPTRFLAPDSLPALFRFPPDMARVDTEPSRLDTPTILSYYREGWGRWF